MTKEAPTETETGDAVPAVNTPTPAEFRRLRERRAELVAELQDIDRQMGFEASPGVKVSRLAAEIAQTFEAHTEHLRSIVETPFESAFGTADDIWGAIDLLMELGDALDAAGPWRPIRKALAGRLDE